MATLDSDESPAPTTQHSAAVWTATDPSGQALTQAEEEEEDYYDEEPTRRPVRKPFGPLALILCALVIAGGAFYGGVRLEKSKVPASSSASGSLAALAARFRAGGGAGATGGTGGTGGGAGGANAVRGTITLVDGSNIYVTDSSGNIFKVSTSPGSQITMTSAATVQKLHPGDNVTVIGPADANGTVTATVVTDTGAGTGGGRGARAGAGTGTAGAGTSSAGRAGTGGGGAVVFGGPPGG